MHAPGRALPFAIGAVNALPVGVLLRNALAAIAALLTRAGLTVLAGLSQPPSFRPRVGGDGRAAAGLAGSGGPDGRGWCPDNSSDAGSSSSSSDSGSSPGGDFSGGGSSGGGGASDSG